MRPDEPIDLTMDPADSFGGAGGGAGGEYFDEELKRALEMSVHDMHQQQQQQQKPQITQFAHNGTGADAAGGDDDLARAIEMSIASSRQDPRYQQHSGAIDSDTEDQIRNAAATAAAAEQSNRAQLQGTHGAAGGNNDCDQLVPIKLRPAPQQQGSNNGVQQSVNFADAPAGFVNNSQSAPGFMNLKPRPEVQVPLAKSPSTTAEAQSSSGLPPTGLVASYYEAQCLLVMLQALYAVPAARKAILGWPLPDPRVRGRPEDLEGYWKGGSLPPATAEEQDQKVVAEKEEIVQTEDSEMLTQQASGEENAADIGVADEEQNQKEGKKEPRIEMKEVDEELARLEAVQAPHISCE